MTWWEKKSGIIPLSWFGYILLFVAQWRLENRTAEGLRALSVLPVRASVMLFVLATVIHYLLYRWRHQSEGWLWAIWCSLLYAAIIVSMILWRLSMTPYG